MKYAGVPVRIYALIVNSEDEVLVSEGNALPKADFSAGKDFRENLSECVRSSCGLRPLKIRPAGILREHGNAENACMATAFWVDESTGSMSPGWTYVPFEAARKSLSGFDASILDACLRARPLVAVQ